MPASTRSRWSGRLWGAALAAAAGLWLAARPAAGASSPQRIGFQGKLLDTANNPRDGNFDITFRIFNVASGGSALWSETQTAVPVTNGAFSAALGAVNALTTGLFSGASAYLEVEVAPDPPMTPRHLLLMSPVAFRALTADDLPPGDADYVQVGSPLQAGAVFHVASGTVAGPFQATGPSSFTATGSQTFSLNASSGVRVQAGTLRVEGSGGLDATGQVRASTVAAVSGLLLPGSAASTIEGSVRWNGATDKLTVGDGAGAKTMADTDSAQTLTNKTLNSTGGNTVDATHLRTRLLAADAPSHGMTIQWDAGAARWYPVYPATISVIATPFTPGGNITLTADTMYLVPVAIPGVLSLSQIRFRVTTTAAGKGDVGLYNSAGTLVADGGANSADFTTTGAKAVLVSGAPKLIYPGQYYLALVASDAPAIRGINLAAASAGVVKGLGTITLAAGAGTTLPATIGLGTIVDGSVALFISLNE